MNKIYKTSNQNNTVTRNSSLKVLQPPRTKTLTQKCVLHLGPFIWNGLPDDVNLANNVNTIKHKKITISMYTMGKLPPLSSHFNNKTIIRTGI